MSQPVDELQPLSDQLKIRSIEVRGAEGPLPARLYTSGDAGAKRDSSAATWKMPTCSCVT
jgi:acetyl esterase